MDILNNWVELLSGGALAALVYGVVKAINLWREGKITIGERETKQQLAKDKTVIQGWQQLLETREAQYGKDRTEMMAKILFLEEKVEEINQREKECRITAARQEQEIQYLRKANESIKHQITELKNELVRRGIKEDTSGHPPLGG